jgi:hypothetical protein
MAMHILVAVKRRFMAATTLIRIERHDIDDFSLNIRGLNILQCYNN